jgi:recombinational DNA repair protein (RecF pathway)
MGVINSFNLLNELMLKSPITTQEFFTFYRTILELIKNETNFDEKIKILIILEKYCVLCGIPMEVKCCVVCKSIVVHTISFANHGLLCKNCTNSEHVQPQGSYVTKVFYFLFNEEYDKMGRYYQELDYCIKLLKKYIKDELDMVLYSLKGF